MYILFRNNKKMEVRILILCMVFLFYDIHGYEDNIFLLNKFILFKIFPANNVDFFTLWYKILCILLHSCVCIIFALHHLGILKTLADVCQMSLHIV